MRVNTVRLLTVAIPLLAAAAARVAEAAPGGVEIPSVRRRESVFDYVERHSGKRFSGVLYRRVIGAASAFKEGDQIAGVAAANERSRLNARRLLANTRIADIYRNPLHRDALHREIQRGVDRKAYREVRDWTLGRLKRFLLSEPEAEVKRVAKGLSSDVIGAVVKLMSNAELIRVGQKVFNPLSDSRIGAKGYLGARIQPNSPTDHPEDLRWQVFNGWSFGVGDLMLGTNPAADNVETVARSEAVLKDLVRTFGLQEQLPWCVLSHIDNQAEVEENASGSTALFFQSIAGVESAAHTFKLTTAKMIDYAAQRDGPYGLYLETGQGGDASNGHALGFDMGQHEARKYGLARRLAQTIERVKGPGSRAWVAVNDVAGFIGPEVFRTKEQLVRVALEDTVMGKLHGLTMGLDVCATLHMNIGIKDLEWALEQIAPANPAFLMGLPTPNDPMLSYLTTSFKNHLWLRKKFGFKVDDRMWDFFTNTLQVVNKDGTPTKHFGDPVWVYYKYRRALGDTRHYQTIAAEGRAQAREVVARNVPLDFGHGKHPWQMNPQLAAWIEHLVADAKESLYSELSPEFRASIADAIEIDSAATGRELYISRPAEGERLSPAAAAALQRHREAWGKRPPQVQIVISDGLNARALMDQGHLQPYLAALRRQLARQGFTVAKENIVLTNGRVRAGYRIGESLFGANGSKRHAVIHVLGERPGTGHHNFSAYLIAPTAKDWARSRAACEAGKREGQVDHDQTKLVSGISDTAYDPAKAARQTVRYLEQMMR